MKTLAAFGLALTLASAPAQARAATASAVTYFRSDAGGFERSVTMTFPVLPRLGEEIRAGTNIYRVVRVLFPIEGTEAHEVRLYFERVGPAPAE